MRQSVRTRYGLRNANENKKNYDKQENLPCSREHAGNQGSINISLLDHCG